ncbi:MAG: glycoside hydrolase family 13 protein, partial [Muribaculaceae bacterium]|nr:glycoside hydrolase family 13 protein [Muribaculaceae bacterium]
MKRLAMISLSLLAGAASIFGAKKAPVVTNIEPPCWWAGMSDPSLQVMVTGPGIAAADVTADYPGVTLKEAISLDSPNYKLLYLDITPQAKPGTIDLKFNLNGRKAVVPYELKERTRKGEEYIGFDASDVLYLLMPDRFAQGDMDAAKALDGLDYPITADRTDPNGRHGGNIRGIINNLDYIDSLGVTAIWSCPVLENDMPGGSYHGYATTDYYRIDPRFGTNEEWQELVAEANKRGIKVVMDMIFNHSGLNHPWIADKPSKDWFNHPEGTETTNFRLSTIHDPYVSDYDLDHTVNGWFVTAMPDLNQRNPHLMKYLIQNSIWWIESSKINGIRMDTYPYADLEGMASWAKAILAEYPNFNIVGECWYGNEAGSAFWQKGNRLNPRETELPTVMDFLISINGHKYFDEETDPWNGLNHLYDHLAMDFLYPDPQKVLTFLDNHDTDRFLLAEPDSLGSWKQAVTFLLTSRGIPQLYYGTELLMNGSKEGSDGYVRRDFPGGFPGDTINAFTPEGRTPLQNEAWDYMSKLLHWRRGEANEVIAKGSLKHFMPQNGMYVYRRKLGDKEVTVLMNGTTRPLTVTMERTLEILPYGTRLHDIISGEDVTIAEQMT